jgi:formylglycine-generating enzyme required for sulfatase activity
MKSISLIICPLFPFLAALPCTAQSVVHSAIAHEAGIPANRAVITWEATPPNSYNILTTGDLNQPWQVLNPTPILATNTTMTFEDQNTLSQRFYQVVNRDVSSNMVWIRSGTFTMGSPASEAERDDWEGPLTEVTISRGFWTGRFEVTQQEYLDVVGTNPSLSPGTNRPVEVVNWSDATNYCGLVTERERVAGRLPTGYEYRLPTEAEWEYSCRAGTTTAFYFGPALRSGMANFDGRFEYEASTGTIANPTGTYLGQTTVVGSYAPNAWGLYDMHGNVWEWCLDWWGDSLPGGSVTDPRGPATGELRVLRGGCWFYFAKICRSADRFKGNPAGKSELGGFRVVLAPTPAPMAPGPGADSQPGKFVGRVH